MTAVDLSESVATTMLSSLTLSPERHIPWDILASIVSFVCCPTLKTLSLVSKDLETEAGKYLFRNISIRTRGQSVDAAREQVEAKLSIMTRQQANIQSFSLEAHYGRDADFWGRKEDGGRMLGDLWVLLEGMESLRKLTLNIDAYEADFVPDSRTWRLPRLQHLTISCNSATSLDFLIPSLDSLETLSLKCETTQVPEGEALAKTFPPGSVFRSLRELEVGRGWQLPWLLACSFPVLQKLHTTIAYPDPSDVLRQLLLSVPAPTSPSTGLKSFTMRAGTVVGPRSGSSSEWVDGWTHATFYSSLLFSSQLISSPSHVLSNLENLTLVHEPPPTREELDAIIEKLVASLPSLRTISLCLPSGSLAGTVSIKLSDDLLEKLFPSSVISINATHSCTASRKASGLGRGTLEKITIQLLMPFPPWDLERVYFRNKEDVAQLQGRVWGTYETGADCY